MGRQFNSLLVILCVVFSSRLFTCAANEDVVPQVVLNCPCQLKISCFKPLEITKVNETSCADENFVRCCSQLEPGTPLVKQIVVITSSTSTEPKLADNISVIFPSEMSGIPQTTPSNMPDDDYMIKMIDSQSGNQMLLVFPKHEEATSEAPSTTVTTTTTTTTLMTTSSTTPIPVTTTLSTTTTVRPKTSTTEPIKSTTAKPNRGSGKRRRITAPKNTDHQAELKVSSPKSKTKIYDVSRRRNFLRRQPQPSQVNMLVVATTKTPTVAAVTPHFNEELRIQIDQEHKAMIENLKTLLATTTSDNGPVRRPQKMPSRSHRFNSIERLVNVEMDKVIENMKKKPYRGKVKYQDYKWAAIPESYQEQRSPPREIITRSTTKRPTTTRRPIIPSVQPSKHYFPSLPFDEFESVPATPLLADFKPSPLWSLHAENLEIVEINTRSPRKYTAVSPFEPYAAESGFVPVVHNGDSLQIVGPVPHGYTKRIDDSRLRYDLPEAKSTDF